MSVIRHCDDCREPIGAAEIIVPVASWDALHAKANEAGRDRDAAREQLRGAVEDLRYALRCAEAGESWLGTAQAIRGALRTLGVDPASPGGQ